MVYILEPANLFYFISHETLLKKFYVLFLSATCIQGIWKKISASVQSLKPKMFFFIHSFI